MDRQDFIDSIESLFPIDAPFEKTAQIGERLLMEAIRESDWRDLPEDILSLYAVKCEREENTQFKNLAKA